MWAVQFAVATYRRSSKPRASDANTLKERLSSASSGYAICSTGSDACPDVRPLPSDTFAAFGLRRFLVFRRWLSRVTRRWRRRETKKLDVVYDRPRGGFDGTCGVARLRF